MYVNCGYHIGNKNLEQDTLMGIQWNCLPSANSNLRYWVSNIRCVCFARIHLIELDVVRNAFGLAIPRKWNAIIETEQYFYFWDVIFHVRLLLGKINNIAILLDDKSTFCTKITYWTTKFGRKTYLFKNKLWCAPT